MWNNLCSWWHYHSVIKALPPNIYHEYICTIYKRLFIYLVKFSAALVYRFWRYQLRVRLNEYIPFLFTYLLSAIFTSKSNWAILPHVKSRIYVNMWRGLLDGLDFLVVKLRNVVLLIVNNRIINSSLTIFYKVF